VTLGHQEEMGIWDLRETKELVATMVTSDLQVLEEEMDRLEPRVTRATKVFLEERVLVLKDLQDSRVRKENLDSRDYQEKLDQQENQVKWDSLERRATWEELVFLD